MGFSTRELRPRKNVLHVRKDDFESEEVIRLVREYDPLVEVKYRADVTCGEHLPSLHTPLSAFSGLEDIQAFIAAEAKHPVVKDYLAGQQ
jgi:hypothetical protein